jgi:cytochrome c-type biogenesis protein CcmH
MVFWLLAALMTLMALAFILIPLLRARAATGPSAVEANLEVLRGQRREIDADVDNGILPADARDEALAELVDRAEKDLVPPSTGAVASPRRPWITAALVAVSVPAVAVGVYLATGMPAATDPRITARDPAASPPDDKQILAMVESLAKKVKERPDDAQGWALLARSMGALNRFKESADAYERVARLVPNDPDVLSDYADALGMAQGRTLEGKPYQLAKQALAIDPKHNKALAIAGTAALDAGEFDAALRYWQTLADQLTPGTDDANQVRAVIGEVKARAAAAGKEPAPPVRQAFAPLPKSVSGSVSIAPAIASRVGSADTLFIFARAEGGPRMPLAVLRGSARKLPVTFTLDDSLAMSPNTKLSSAELVRIEARISRSGNAMPQSGDLVGTSGVVKPGARDVNIVVDKVVP